MSFPPASVPTRLIICVDGTSYTAPGVGKSTANQTNVHRIYAGVKRGICFDTRSGETYNQVAQYSTGIGSADGIQVGVFGSGYLKQIQEVYESCCRLTGGKDEVWLFGFSRGAFVCRAVAGLLNTFGAMTSAGQPEFERDFKKLLKEADAKSGSSGLMLSPISTMSLPAAGKAPRIRFVGVFDTVKAINDDSAFDISFNSSIQHMRHAVALHEDRKALAPEYVFPESLYKTALQEYKRSFVEAHFIGTHTDLGGSAKKAGLGLYPLQWMLLEARKCGLFITYFDGGPRGINQIHDPLSVVFPKPEKKGTDLDLWSCTTANGIVISMQDLRGVHNTKHYAENYAIKLNTRPGIMRQKKPREAFYINGALRGYCDWAPQGTIIHPSVYFLLDEHINVALETKELRLQRFIEDWREKMLGSSHGMVNPGFWLDGDEEDSPNPGAIRVLVCGNTGVGKSTLINKTFGVDVTQSSNRSRGIHDVREEITFEGRPDLIVHDSGGFEAGADEEYQAIEAFLKDKATVVDVMDRLHVICPRTLQTATEKLFKAVSQYAAEVPIVVVATKKDDFLDIKFGAHRKAMKKEGKRFDEEACEQYAEEKLEERIEIIRSEMQSVPGDDNDSIANLSKTTSECFDTDKVRLLYIRAQVTRIDLKIDLALCEVMRRYKKLVRSATGTAYAAGGATINSRIACKGVTTGIINCFGLPTVSADVAVQALKQNVWSTGGTTTGLALADAFQAIGIAGTVAAGGIPAWLVTGSISAPYVVPATCRLFLIMASDLTLVLARSFKELAFRARGQPNERDVTAAARNYRVRGYSRHVHAHIKKLVPRRNMAASYKVEIIREGIEEMFTVYKDKLMEDVDLPLKVESLNIGSDADADSIAETDSSLVNDYRDVTEAYAKRDPNVPDMEATTPVAELDANRPLVELPTERNVVELPTERKVAELQDASSTRKRYELES
ncbi:hypothetical protein LTR37_000694 [Vermiconidia calcicola]|uniref:Uncharacterized protein n=1 Tax=Vermiconidia calcicola TaxID=1690605 RepID=A0ACC3NYE1_9PEZI|nr:hypothetical protein LTR37_000694 [Vermiconidia calcicola]